MEKATRRLRAGKQAGPKELVSGMFQADGGRREVNKMTLICKTVMSDGKVLATEYTCTQ